MAVTAPAAPSAPAVPSVPAVQLAPTHGGGDSSTTEFGTTLVQHPVEERPERPTAPQRPAASEKAAPEGANTGTGNSSPAAQTGSQAAPAAMAQGSDMSAAGQEAKTVQPQPLSSSTGGHSLPYWPFVLVFVVALLTFVIARAARREPPSQPPKPSRRAASKKGPAAAEPKSHFEVRI